VQRLPERVEIAGYYVVSEALTNAAKHAQASVVHVEVGIGPSDGALTLSIADDGVGGADAARGSGIVGLRDRIDALGARYGHRKPRGRGHDIARRAPHLTEPAPGRRHAR
jgi:signal transduction histidine kinase